MSIRDIIEEVEKGCVEDRYSSGVFEDAGEVEEYFEDFEDAAYFVASYRDFYSREEAFDDPVGYAESWYESFGSMDGITDSFEL